MLVKRLTACSYLSYASWNEFSSSIGSTCVVIRSICHQGRMDCPYISADIDLPWQFSFIKHNSELRLFPDHFGFGKSPISPQKRSDSATCKFEIIPDEMTKNRAFWILDCSWCHHRFLFGISKITEGVAPAFIWNIGETNAVATSLSFTKIAGKVNQRRKNTDLRCFLRLDYA